MAPEYNAKSHELFYFTKEYIAILDIFVMHVNDFELHKNAGVFINLQYYISQGHI